MQRTGGRRPARALGAPHACATRSRRDVQTALQAGNPAVRYCRWRLLLLREVLERDAAMRLRSSRGADCAPPAHVRVEVVDGELTVEEAWDLVG